MRKFFERTGKIAEYLIACLWAVIFALFCSARVGYFILFVLVLAPVISVLITFLAAAFINIDTQLSANICQKDSIVTLKIEFRKACFYLPLPGAELKYYHSQGLEVTETVNDMTARGRVSRIVTVRLKGVYCGCSFVKLSEVYFVDFLNIVRFKARRLHGNGFKVGVIPQVRLIPSDSQLLRDALSGADMTGMSEDTIEENSGNFGGFPGYDHREYMPGDPVRRINYKLSARKDQYFVRLDEKQVYGNIEVFIDPKVPPEIAVKGDKEIAAWWDNVLQDSLGLCETLLSRQFSVSLKFYIENEEITRSLKLPGDAAALCEELAWCGYKV